MQTKFIALLVAGTALTGCCASGSLMPTSVAPIAWDGLGEAPTANGELGSENRPKRRTARNREIVVGPLSETPARSEAKAWDDEWTRMPNEDREADAKLARHLKICRNC